MIAQLPFGVLYISVLIAVPILWLVFAWWCSRGMADQDEITRHRLKDHHGFDPEQYHE